MEAIDPAYGAVTLLVIAALAVALLLVLIMVVKLHAFVALVLVSVLTAVAAGIPVGDVPAALVHGFVDTIGSVTLLVGFGAMVGRPLEVTGGAQVLADTLISRSGRERAPLALGVAALLVARQRLQCLPGEPLLRHGRDDHADDVDGGGNDAGTPGLRDQRRPGAVL